MVKFEDGIEVSEKDLFKKIIVKELGPSKPILCKFAQELLEQIPSYFWVESASSTGKYHPEHDLGEGGLARHALMVYRWLKLLLEDNEMDMVDFIPGMIVAALFHDCCKRGMPDQEKSQYTLFEHPLLSAKFVLDKAEAFAKGNKALFEQLGEEEDDFKHDIAVALNTIETHMGRWNTNKYSDVVLPKPKSAIQYIVHLADYISSRKCTKFDLDEFHRLWTT